MVGAKQAILATSFLKKFLGRYQNGEKWLTCLLLYGMILLGNCPTNMLS